jgi:glycosyltransferase involved in cell wall biosynthesis
VRIVHQLLSGDVAGGQLVALRLAQGAIEAGHEALLVSPTDGPVLDRAAAAGIESRIVPLGRSFRLDDAWRYSRALRRERADLLHTHTHFAGNVIGRLAGRLAAVPVVAHMHIENAFRQDRAGRTVQVALDDATARLCARILAVSEATHRTLVRQGYPRRSMEVVYNGVDPARAEPVRLVAGPTVLQVARLAPVKGQRDLIRALPGLEGVSAVFVGRDLELGGAYERELEREAERLGVRERVVFAGQRDDVPALFAGCDICVLPSFVEGLPLVLLEAMTQARPVVATPVGGTPELVVDGETGVLVPPGDTEALLLALRGLLSDPERARRLGEAGRRRVEERFSAEAMTRRVLEVYGEVTRTMRP